MNLIERFFSKVNISDGCWEWKASKTKDGYGRIQMFRNGIWSVELANRVSWFIHTSEWPTQFILHKCDNPACVRYSHLFEGTQSDNMQDASRKGRAKGYGSYLTHCKRGHEFTEENTYLKNGKRLCRECRRLWKRNAKIQSND